MAKNYASVISGSLTLSTSRRAIKPKQGPKKKKGGNKGTAKNL